ncbi:MAG: hypothetical protein M1814_004517 [Vezdaea aestivalis]|nr:MAG: hypothetical protein M1814_004517 [Vezdaea aestivalis]
MDDSPGFPSGWRANGGYWYGNGPPPDSAPPPWGAPPPPFPGPVAYGPPQLPPQAPQAPSPGYTPWPWQFGQPPPVAPPAPGPVIPPHMPLPPVQLSGPNVMPGANYLFPTEHTSLHIVQAPCAPWDLPPGTPFPFHIYRCPSSLTIKGLLSSLGVEGEPYRIGVSECLELGNGSWTKGTTVMANEERAEKQLEWFGWDESRGTGPKPPVWLMVERL